MARMSRRFGRTAAILLVVAAVVGGLLLLAQDQETLKIQSALGAGEPGHAAYVAALVGADLTAGNRYEVLTNGDQFLPAMLEAIAAARTRVVLETYIYDSGDVAAQFTTALEQAARRGVMCAIVVDAVGSAAMERGHVQRLESAGCVVATFNPPHWYKLEELNYRSHRKILVVDGEIGFIGGAGIADQFAGHAQDRDHWRETQIRMRGPIVRLLEAAFYENFSEVHGPVIPVVNGPSPSTDASGPSVVIRSSPSGGSNDLKRLYLLAVASARRSLDITSPYFVTDESTMWALEDAVTRGVRIRILVEGDITDARPVKYSSRNSYDRLLQLGIEIHEYQPTMLHTKALVVDGIYCIAGSANFDNRSFELNDELNIGASSPDLARRLLEDFHVDLGKSKRLTLEAWRQRPMLDNVREHFWSYFAEIF
jgi:cardiolipin synthase A/B